MASIVIGVILAGTAVLLAYESKGLLIGEGARPELVAKIEQIAAEKPGIDRVNELLTMHLGPYDVLVTLSLDFDDKLTAGRVEAAISELETSIKSDFPEVTRVFIEAQSWRAHLQSQEASRRDQDPERHETENEG